MRRAPAIVAALLAVLSGLVASPAGAVDEAVAARLERARAELAAGRLEAAEAGFRALLAEAPGLLDAYRGLARTLGAAGRPGEGAALLRPVVEALLDARPGEAAELGREASALTPRDPALPLLRGRALLRAQRHAEAAEALERAVELGDRRPGTTVLLASAWWEAGRPERAEALYREALPVDPSGVAAHQLGRLLAWLGRPAEALPFLERAAAARPLAADVALDLARARAAAGEDAVAAFRRSVEQEPESHAGWYGLALALKRRGDDAEAAEAMERYRSLYAALRERNRREALSRAELDRGWSLLADGRSEAAAAHFATLEVTVESLAGGAAAARARGRDADAVALLERALALDPDRDDLRRLLAEARAAAGS